MKAYLLLLGQVEIPFADCSKMADGLLFPSSSSVETGSGSTSALLVEGRALFISLLVLQARTKMVKNFLAFSTITKR